MWEPVAPERDVPDIHNWYLSHVWRKRCDNCVHGDMPMSEKPCRFNNVDMMDLFQELQTVERNMLLRKGHDYASRGDLGNPFENFDVIAEEVDLPSERVLYIYMAKHLRVIKAYIDYGTLESGESLWGRIIDIRNYLALLAGMAKAKGDI
jgi:hypothetical protein